VFKYLTHNTSGSWKIDSCSRNSSEDTNGDPLADKLQDYVRVRDKRSGRNMLQVGDIL